MAENWYETTNRLVWHLYPCGYCGVRARSWCVTKTGKRASYLHSYRGQELRDLVHQCYFEGLEDGKMLEKSRQTREQEVRARVGGSVQQYDPNAPMLMNHG